MAIDTSERKSGDVILDVDGHEVAVREQADLFLARDGNLDRRMHGRDAQRLERHGLRKGEGGGEQPRELRPVRSSRRNERFPLDQLDDRVGQFAQVVPSARLTVLYDVSHNICKEELHEVDGRFFAGDERVAANPLLARREEKNVLLVLVTADKGGLRTDPAWDDLREESEFKELLKKVDLNVWPR